MLKPDHDAEALEVTVTVGKEHYTAQIIVAIELQAVAIGQSLKVHARVSNVETSGPIRRDAYGSKMELMHVCAASHSPLRP